MSYARIVVDTNILVSAGLWPTSTPADALRKVLQTGILVTNRSMMLEMAQVFQRSKFDRYATIQMRRDFLNLVLDKADIAPDGIPVSACRDPRDNHVLEAAVNGAADTIITGDTDLLVLSPFHSVRILTPGDYLK